MIVDSATALYRSEYIGRGRGELFARQGGLGQCMRKLLGFADEVVEGR